MTDFCQSLLQCILSKDVENVHQLILDSLGSISNELETVATSNDLSENEYTEYLDDLRDSVLLLMFQYRAQYANSVTDKIRYDYLAALLSVALDTILLKGEVTDISGFITMCKFNLEDSVPHILDVLVQSERLSMQNSSSLHSLFSFVCYHFAKLKKFDILLVVKLALMIAKIDENSQLLFKKVLSQVCEISDYRKLGLSSKFPDIFPENVTGKNLVQNLLDLELCPKGTLEAILDYASESQYETSSGFLQENIDIPKAKDISTDDANDFVLDCQGNELQSDDDHLALFDAFEIGNDKHEETTGKVDKSSVQTESVGGLLAEKYINLNQSRSDVIDSEQSQTGKAQKTLVQQEKKMTTPAPATPLRRSRRISETIATNDTSTNQGITPKKRKTKASISEKIVEILETVEDKEDGQKDSDETVAGSAYKTRLRSRK